MDPEGEGVQPGVNTIARMYNQLLKVIGSGNIWKELDLLGQLFNLDIKNFDSGEDHLQTSKCLVEELNVQDTFLPDRLAVCGILKGLDSRFSGMIQALNHRQEFPTLEETEKSIRLELTRLKKRKDVPLVANFANDAAGATGHGSRDGGRNYRPRGDSSVQCTFCHKAGHAQITCWLNPSGPEYKEQMAKAYVQLHPNNRITQNIQNEWKKESAQVNLSTIRGLFTKGR